MCPLPRDTFDTAAIDWLQHTMEQSGVDYLMLRHLPYGTERHAVLVHDPVQHRDRYIRGRHLREAIERAVAVQEQPTSIKE